MSDTLSFTSEHFVEHDRCQRFQTWNARYSPLRVSFNYAMNDALQVALDGNDPVLASERVMSLGANPGMDHVGPNLYSAVLHHSRLAELLAAYVLSVGKCVRAPELEMDWGEFQPTSFLLPDGRLRRIILCDRWTAEREQMERFSWRTAVDTAATGRPMVITALVIGGIRDGFRPSPWTTAYEHPKNGTLRIQKRQGGFVDSWRKVYREQSGTAALEWLRLMQSDECFEGLVHSIVEDVPKDRDRVLEDVAQMAGEIQSSSLRPTRSNCYRFTPCPFLSACVTARTPAQAGWTERDTASPFTVLNS